MSFSVSETAVRTARQFQFALRAICDTSWQLNVNWASNLIARKRQKQLTAENEHSVLWT
jgi:hypothetical protein